MINKVRATATKITKIIFVLLHKKCNPIILLFYASTSSFTENKWETCVLEI